MQWFGLLFVGIKEQQSKGFVRNYSPLFVAVFKLCWYLKPCCLQLKSTSKAIVPGKGKTPLGSKGIFMLQYLLSICVFPLQWAPHHHPTTIHFLGCWGRRVWAILRSEAAFWLCLTQDMGLLRKASFPCREQLEGEWSNVAYNSVEIRFWFNLQAADWQLWCENLTFVKQSLNGQDLRLLPMGRFCPKPFWAFFLTAGMDLRKHPFKQLHTPLKESAASWTNFSLKTNFGLLR